MREMKPTSWQVIHSKHYRAIHIHTHTHTCIYAMPHAVRRVTEPLCPNKIKGADVCSIWLADLFISLTSAALDVTAAVLQRKNPDVYTYIPCLLSLWLWGGVQDDDGYTGRPDACPCQHSNFVLLEHEYVHMYVHAVVVIGAFVDAACVNEYEMWVVMQIFTWRVEKCC